MTDFAALLQQGNAWLFAPSAILLGALHGLEPGHSKTLMAAFIVAIRGTLRQAVLLGLSATVSHTAVVWLVALAGLYFGRQWQAETTEARFQVLSAALIVGVAVWMLWRTWHDRHGHHGHEHPHGADAHAHAHAHDIEDRFANRPVTTGQIMLFGLTGGLIPCPASITVLLLCLQLEQASLGLALVLCFSLGLALTLVASGVLAALSLRHVASRWQGFGTLAQRAPYVSGGLILLVGLYLGWTGLRQLPA